MCPLGGGTISGDLTVEGKLGTTADSVETATGAFTDPFVAYGAGNLSGGTFNIYKWGRVVTIIGQASITTAQTLEVTSIQMGTVPAGYRPRQQVYTIQQASAGYHWFLQINAAGKMWCGRYSDGQNYKTTSAQTSSSAGTWFPFTVTYII